MRSRHRSWSVFSGLWLLCACSDASPAMPDAALGAGAAGRGVPDAGDTPASASPSAGAAPPSLRVHIDGGEIEGELVGTDVRRFVGIPYAKPPVGPLRWRAPEAPEPWGDVRPARQVSLPCPQAAARGAVDAIESEDCLYLNVWASAAPAPEPRAVMVWIHGGGNVNGSASELGYDGQHFARTHGVVLVSLNYRLGVFGFFAHDGLLAEGTSSGNQGLWDQQLALRWVQENIAAFGGDPDNVTIFGESAGSLDVCLHVAAPGSRGLFHRAISQSGGCTTVRPRLETAAARAPEFARVAGCSETDELACLRTKSRAELMATAVGSGMSFAPVVDRVFIPEQPRALFERGEVAHVPYLLGSTHDEGTFLVGGELGLMSEQEYSAALVRRYGEELAPRVAAVYPSSAFAAEPNPFYAALARAVGDQRLVCSTFDVALRALQLEQPVYMYNFEIEIDGPDGPLGAAHAAELVYVFGTAPAFTPEQRAVSDRMQAYWANFAKHGDPNGAELLAWPPLSEAGQPRLNFGLSPSVVHDFRAAECVFWRMQYDAAFASMN
jgi:para-nitrobenzyl esterase